MISWLVYTAHHVFVLWIIEIAVLIDFTEFCHSSKPKKNVFRRFILYFKMRRHKQKVTNQSH